MNIKILAIIAIFLLLGSSFVILTKGETSAEIWKIRIKEPWFNYMFFINDKEMQKNDTYEKLKTFFNGCNTPKEFFDRIQTYVNESLDMANYDLSMNECRLSIIVDTIIDYNATLYCQQQSLLFAAGVKAMFSHYDEQLGRYVLNDGCGDFKLEIWRSFDLHPPILPYRSHSQIVVDKWNGIDIFEINDKNADKIEIDNWENEYREFDKRNDCLFYSFLPAKLNSILYTN
jgi:hypothetical protein